nr:T9SS type A sorting domain-containing protein [Bacteroidota bacterium]
MKFTKSFTLSVLSCVLFSFSILAQNYVPFPYSDAEWNELEYHWQPMSHINYSYILQGDTTIESVVYQKIIYDDSGSSSDLRYYAGAIRQDTVAKKVFVRDCSFTSEEVDLYDFSKSPGDTVLVGEEGYGPDGGYYIIEHIDSILIGDQYRRTFHFTNPIYGAYWIEGIGSTRGLFSPVNEVPTGFNWWELTCFWHNEELIFLDPEFNECFPNWTGVDENLTKLQNVVTIYPNPVTDLSTIELNSVGDGTIVIKIVDLQGRVIAKYELSGEKQVFINRNDFNKGIYFIEAIGKNGKLGMNKVIVN